MKRYICKLVHKGIVRATFLRDGESAEAVLKELRMFQWPGGKWTIEDAG